MRAYDKPFKHSFNWQVSLLSLFMLTIFRTAIKVRIAGLDNDEGPPEPSSLFVCP